MTTEVVSTENTPQRGFRVTAWHISLVLVLIGILISSYLSYTHLANAETICIEQEGFDCDLVQHSVWATLAGIPIAYLGLGSYIFIGLVLLLENRIGLLQEYGRLLLFAVTLFGWVYSMWLVYVQGVILKSWCQWCLGHELTFTLLFIVTIYRLWKSFQPEKAK